VEKKVETIELALGSLVDDNFEDLLSLNSSVITAKTKATTRGKQVCKAYCSNFESLGK